MERDDDTCMKKVEYWRQVLVYNNVFCDNLHGTKKTILQLTKDGNRRSGRNQFRAVERTTTDKVISK